MKNKERILRRPEVEKLTGLGRSSLYAAMSAGNFPRPVKIGERAVGWPESVIDQWIDDRISQKSGGENVAER